MTTLSKGVNGEDKLLSAFFFILNNKETSLITVYGVYGSLIEMLEGELLSSTLTDIVKISEEKDIAATFLEKPYGT